MSGVVRQTYSVSDVGARRCPLTVKVFSSVALNALNIPKSLAAIFSASQFSFQALAVPPVMRDSMNMKDLRVALSPVKGSGNLICTVGMFVVSIIVTGARTGTGAGACLEVLIFGLGAGHLGCSSFLLSSLLVSVLYLLLLGATMFLGSILNAAGLNSLLVGLTRWLFLHLSLGDPVKVAGAVEVNTLDLPPVVSVDTVAW